MTSYRLFPSTNGPSSGTGYSGNYLAGAAWQVTTGGCWLEGYWWWVCNSGQQTGAVSCALWEVTSSTAGDLIAGSAVTSGTLTAGQWNYIPLSSPVPLSVNCGYIAAVGFSCTAGFPLTSNQFGSGDPYSAGITNGPLFLPTGQTTPGTPFSCTQGLFQTSTSDPTAVMPDEGSNNGNFWVDVQVTTTPPAGTSYRLWPSQPYPVNWQPDTPQANWTLGTEFTLSQACTLDRIWFYSPSGSTQLPTDAGIWLVSSQALVSGTHNASPSWSGSAGSGWVSCSYSGVTLPAGDYKVTVYNGGSVTNAWSATTYPYWGTSSGNSGPAAAAGITSGPLTAPDDANATSPGQSTYQLGAGPSFAYPDTYAAGIGSPVYWVDIEVTPTAPPAPPSRLLAAAPPWPLVRSAVY